MLKLKHDYIIYKRQHELEHFSKIKRIIWLLIKTTFPIVLFFRLSSHSNKLIKYTCIPIYKLIRIISGVQIPRETIIGKGLFLPHYGCIVLNKRAVYGDYITIYHGVTVGAKGGDSKDFKNPVIGNNVKLSSSSIILGGITIGDNVIVGAGSVVVKSIRSNATCVGNPAKIICVKQ